MKLHIIEITDNETGVERIFNHAFTDRENANYYADLFNQRHLTKTASVKEVDLPFIGRSVCYVRSYYGIGGGLDVPMYDKIRNSKIYSCADHAKIDDIWRRAREYFYDNPEEKKHETDTMIATDRFGKPFDYGYDGFNVSIKHIRVIKAGVEYDENLFIW